MKLKLKSSLALLMVFVAVLPASIIGGLLIKQQTEVETNYRVDLIDRLSTTLKQEFNYRFYLLSTALDVLSRDRLLVQGIDDFFLTSHVDATLANLVDNTPLVQAAYLVDANWNEVENYNGINGINSFSGLKVLLNQKVSTSKNTGDQWVFNYADESLMPDRFNPSHKGIAIGVPIYQSTLTEGLKRNPLGYLIVVVPVENIIKVLRPYLKDGEHVIFHHNGMDKIVVYKGKIDPLTPTVSKTEVVTIDNKYITEPMSYNAQVFMNKYLGENPFTNSLKILTIVAIIVVILALLTATISYRWFAKPLTYLMDSVRACLGGNYNIPSKDLRFSELIMVNNLIQKMAMTIKAQLSDLEDKNTKLMTFNDQLENKVHEKTLELTHSLQREEKRRTMLQSLLSFSNKLQHGDIHSTVMTQLVSLYPYAGWGMKLFVNQNNNWVCEGVSEICLDSIDADAHCSDYFRVNSDETILQCFKIVDTHNKLLGVIVMKTPNIERDDYEIISLFIRQLSAELEGRLLNEELERSAITDPLTGLSNRKAFDVDFDEWVKVTHRYPEQYLGLFMIDLNGLKQANDEYGHHMGDQLLIETGRLIKSVCRSTDKVYRLGGDEYAIIIKHGDNAGCNQLKERLLQLLMEDHYASLPPGDKVGIHFAMGSASTESHDVHTIYQVADKAMYLDKKAYYDQMGKKPR
ncbi:MULTISPECIES: GGDEF domain-containing protein [unclassified Photobacterium]|uniref:GGDEF domain-containing protein n=1 Tax=unclassified Photobacterium TaxID=2628852 RepID=UPI001EE0AB9F|nr:MULTISPECIES: GGDEF domain-containing protein [unclassified Photobacterium]MCG3864268.1 GGDEF domain-containing protein [Photobacterium sp. Ph6]MCG3875762.1 GGDEF domain-containing protein [Photobacterium sp. Ph5]